MTVRQQVLRHPLYFAAFGFGSGLAPKAPGTFGTLAAIPFYLLLAQTPLWLYSTLLLLATGLGIYLCDVTAKGLGVHDHPGIVWDEFVGFWITMIAVPVSLPAIVAGFLLFRLFDILKPWPIRWLDRHVHGGTGIMVDDMLAGVFAAVIMQLLLHFKWLV